MRIICIIDALGPGGAERQMVGLASLLNQEGHVVTVLYHEPKHFFLDQLEKNKVEAHFVSEGTDVRSRFFVYRRLIKRSSPDAVIAYLQGSCMLACLIRLSGVKFKLIVSERNTNQDKQYRDILRFNLFRVADTIVPNSFSQERFIESNFPFLKCKTKTIINFVDTAYFIPGNAHRRTNLILVAATIWPPKNTLGFIHSLSLLRERGLQFKVKWFGKVSDKAEYASQCETLIKEKGLTEYIELCDKTDNILAQYQTSDIFCLPSFYEGTPNSLCEAMSCGLPVLASRVCDNPSIVRDGYNGLLFDPADISNMASTLESMLLLDDETLQLMGQRSRHIAESLFSKHSFLEKYNQLL